MLMEQRDTLPGNCDAAELLRGIIQNHCRGQMLLIECFVCRGLTLPQQLIYPVAVKLGCLNHTTNLLSKLFHCAACVFSVFFSLFFAISFLERDIQNRLFLALIFLSQFRKCEQTANRIQRKCACLTPFIFAMYSSWLCQSDKSK